MIAKKHPLSPEDLFKNRLDQILNNQHPLFKLAHKIDWVYFDREFDPYYVEHAGRPGKPIRLMVALHYLKHAFDASDNKRISKIPRRKLIHQKEK